MALQTMLPPSAQVVGNAFVEQYYHVLHHSPELVYRFYQDSSTLSRPNAKGVMTSVTTMQGINEQILTLDFKNFKAEIKTADSQKSYNDGVTVLVTGCLTGKDNLKRKFAQSFFLAPQDNGYFVLNDVFRYVEENDSIGNHQVNETGNAAPVTSIPESEPIHVSEPPAPDLTTLAEEKGVVEKAYEPSESEGPSINKKDAVEELKSLSNGTDIPAVVELSPAAAQEDVVKKSYASIVKVPKGISGPMKVYVPTNTIKAAVKQDETQTALSVASASSEPPGAVDDATAESSDIHEEAEGRSIYIRNLPFNVTADQLEMEFKKFGPIKQGGVQVRNNRQQGYCFGFVEFLSLDSMNNAIKASPITIGGRQADVEMKRTSQRVGGGRGSFPMRRGGGFWSEGFRGRGGYVGGRSSFGRTEYGSRVEFSGRGRGSGGRGEGGRGRVGGGRGGGVKQQALVSS